MINKKKNSTPNNLLSRIINLKPFFEKFKIVPVIQKPMVAPKPGEPIEKSGYLHKFHLNILNDGRGILNIDAKHLLYLNATAADYVRLFMNENSDKTIVKLISRKYKVKKNEILKDYYDTIERIIKLISESGFCPIHDLGFQTRDDSFQRMNFPLRVDLAITYNCNEKCEHCYVPQNVLNKFPNELDLSGIKRIMDKLWDLGIPHIALTGGEATLRDDLPEIVQYGQDKGFVMGLITNGFRLSDENLVDKLIKAGLDYVQITLESSSPIIHDSMVGIKGAWMETTKAIKNFQERNFYWMTNSTICETNLETINDTIKLIHDLGGKSFAMNGIIYSGKGVKFPYAIDEKDFKPILEEISSSADYYGMRFIWYTPTQYCSINPIEMGLGLKQCSAANTSISIQPNGNVLPCQSYFEPVGNILTDEWDKIWNSPLFIEIRDKLFVEEKCKKCELLTQCGGGCPLYAKQKGKYFGHISVL